MWGEKTKQVIISSMAVLFVCGFSSAWGADNPTATTAGTVQEDSAVKAEYDKVYQELLKTDPNAAEMFEKEFKAYEGGEYVEHEWDPEKAEEDFQKAYQELLEKNPEEAAKMQEMHEKFQEWEKGGRTGPPPVDFERAGESYDHMSEEAKAELAEKWGGTAHDSFEVPAPGETPFDRSTGGESTLSEFDKGGEYEHSMQDYGGMEQERSEQTAIEVERPEMESTHEMTYEREYQYDMPEREQEYQPQPQ